MDIGNTCCKISLYEGGIRKEYLRILTHADSLFHETESFLKKHQQKIEDVMVSCVVSCLWPNMKTLIQKTLHKEAILLTYQDNLGIQINVPHPEEVGSDLLAMTAYAYHQHKKATLLISFGTATVFTFINQKAEFCYAVICPGYVSYRDILWHETDLLKKQDLHYQTSILANNTQKALSVGIVNGYIGMMQHFIQHFRQELATENFIIGACGGEGKQLLPFLPEIQFYEADFVSDGIAYLYERRKTCLSS